jgi:hypothetical protein
MIDKSTRRTLILSQHRFRHHDRNQQQTKPNGAAKNRERKIHHDLIRFQIDSQLVAAASRRRRTGLQARPNRFHRAKNRIFRNQPGCFPETNPIFPRNQPGVFEFSLRGRAWRPVLRKHNLSRTVFFQSSCMSHRQHHQMLRFKLPQSAAKTLRFTELGRSVIPTVIRGQQDGDRMPAM